MRHLGPIHFRFLGDTEEERQYATLFQAEARTMIGQMLSFSGDVSINAFNRRFQDGTRISVAMARDGIVPIFIAEIQPPPLSSIRRREEEEPNLAKQPYFFAGLEYVSGGQCIAAEAYAGGPSQDFVDNKTWVLRDLLDARVIPHLVVWEPASGDKAHDDPVCVKRWSNPSRGKRWTSDSGLYLDYGDDVQVTIDNPALGPMHLNAPADSNVYYSNSIQNAYWWFDQPQNRWYHSLFARNDNNLFVWEHDNRGFDQRTIDPRTGERYLAIAVADSNPPFDSAVPERFKSYDDVSFLTSWMTWDPFFAAYPDSGRQILWNLDPEKDQAPGTSLESNGQPPVPYHPATLVSGNYAIKVVVEGPNDVRFAPLTVRLRVRTGMDATTREPLVEDVYEMTIGGHSHSRRVLYPGGYCKDLVSIYTGPNPVGPAWSSETILANPFGGSSSSSFLPWGLEPQQYEISYDDAPYINSDYHGWFWVFDRDLTKLTGGT